MKLALAAGVGALVAAGGAGAYSSAGVTASALTARLDARQVVTPANKPWTPPAAVADARGTFSGALRVVGGRQTLTWHVTFRDIGVAHLPVADVHLGRPGRFGQVLVRLCAPCSSGGRGTVKVSVAAASAIRAGNSWLTVITERYRNGVIRGQIRVSP
jgi:hypothetical protein